MSCLQWTQDKAWEWYNRQPWIVGCNFIPSTAINQLEMWQAETFDPDTIDRELSWASAIGFNSVRVYLHDLLFQADPVGTKARIDQYLSIAERHSIRTLFVLFDDCWNQEPRLGEQPSPIKGVHNSGWVQSPGIKRVLDPSTWNSLEEYVKGVISAYAVDKRVLMWDLYNEPGNNNLGVKTLPLLHSEFEWARSVQPSQPLTCGIWFDNPLLNDFQLLASDIVSFHHYGELPGLLEKIQELKAYKRPLICSEYMARTRGSLFYSHMPIFKEEDIGCLNWGLVSGKTQTIFPWGSKEGTAEPKIWFHDIFHADGTPYDLQETDFIRKITRRL